MKVSKFIGIAALFTIIGIGVISHTTNESASAKAKIKSSKYIKKEPVRIKSKAYDVYSYPRTLKSNSKFMHYGSSYHSTTFYITKTIKLSNGKSYSWLVNGAGKAYGYINTKATTVYASPKTDKSDSNHTPVRIKTNAYNVYSYPRVLHGASTFMHYGTSYHSTTFYISKKVTTASNVSYSKLTYSNGTLYGYINTKALTNYKTVKDITTSSSKTKYRITSDISNIHNAPLNTTYGNKTTHYSKNYFDTDIYISPKQKHEHKMVLNFHMLKPEKTILVGYIVAI